MSMTYEERKAVYENAIEHYGEGCQIWKAVEEMAELTKELCKLQNGGGATLESLVDEIADVTIMMEQLRLMFYVNDLVNTRVAFKVNRLARRIEENRKEGEM